MDTTQIHSYDQGNFQLIFFNLLFPMNSLAIALSHADAATAGQIPDRQTEARVALRNIAQTDGSLCAWTFLADPDSLDAPAEGPLAGWPLGVKDNIDVAGMPTRCGSTLTSDMPAHFDAACVASLRAAGAIPIGKTVLTEYAYVTPGPTRNPSALRHTPGGSSSGSAAAVAAGHVPIAFGTQTGGSMIRPAAFCGVIGFKPTAGLISRDGMKFASESLDAIGWYGRTMAHVKSVAEVLLPRQTATALGWPRLRLAFLPGHPGYALDLHADMALMDARERLAAHGFQIAEVTKFNVVVDLLAMHNTLMHYEFARNLQAIVARNRGELSAPLLAAVAYGWKIDGSAYLQARNEQASAQARWEEWFGDADLILTTGALGPAPAGLQSTGDSAFNKGWSVLGWPCIHLPTTHAPNGLPLGVMLVARPFADINLLAWAEAIHMLIDARPDEHKFNRVSTKGNS